PILLHLVLSSSLYPKTNIIVCLTSLQTEVLSPMEGTCSTVGALYERTRFSWNQTIRAVIDSHRLAYSCANFGIVCADENSNQKWTYRHGCRFLHCRHSRRRVDGCTNRQRSERNY